MVYVHLFVKYKRKLDIRQNKDTGHPAVIYEIRGKQYKFLSLTHAGETNGIRNVKFTHNPNLKDSSPTYFRPIPQMSHKSNFGKRYSTWTISPSDIRKMKPYMR